MPSSQSVRPGGVILPLATTTSSGRGKPLSTRDKERLIHICQNEKTCDRFADHTKSFWLRMSDLFTQISDREYSWQSCRRCMCAWEEANEQSSRQSSPSSSNAPDEMPQDEPSVQALDLDDGASEPPLSRTVPAGNNPAENQANNGHLVATDASDEDSGEDDLLPETPVHPFRRDRAGAAFDAELATCPADLAGPFVDRLEAFQSELDFFTSVYFGNTRHRLEIHFAFDRFRGELERRIWK